MRIPLVTLFIVLVSISCAEVKPVGFQKLKVESGTLPALAADSSTTGGMLAVQGDFNVLAAGNSAERLTLYWSTVTESSTWIASTARLPAWAGTALSSAGLFRVGGLEAGQITASVVRINTAADGPVLTQLPPLPVALAGAGAAVLGNTLYVVGGASSLQSPTPANSLWLLDLGSPGAVWREGPPLPGKARAFAAVIEQFGMVCVFGGVTLDASGTPAVTSEAWAYRPRPLEGTASAGWFRLADLPRPIVAGQAVPLGQSQVMLAGGDFDAALPPVKTSAASSAPLCYHTITDAWSRFDQTIPVAAPLLAKYKDNVIALGNDGSSRLGFVRTVRNLSWPDYLVIVGYFLLMVVIGYVCSRKKESSEEFSLGNRQVKWWAAGVSMFATGASAISFMAVPALAFSTNLVWLAPVLILIPGSFITAMVVFPLLRRMNITSTYEYLDRRFNRTLRLIASAQCILLQTFGRGSVVLLLPALAIAVVTGMNVYLCVVIMGVLTTIYTTLGGFQAVIWTELFQGVLKFIAPLVMIGACIVSLPGGVSEFVEVGQNYHKFDLALLTWDVTVPALWIILLSGFFTATLVPAGDQPIIQRVFSSPTKEVRKVTAMSAFCGVTIGLISQTLGIAIFCYFRAHPDKFDPTAQNDQVVPLFVTQAMPVGFAGLIVAAIFASAMATVASGMNSVATIFTQDFYLPRKPDTSDHKRVVVMKLTSCLVGVLATGTALLLAALDLKSMMVVWNQIVALLGGGIVGVYSLGMFTRRANGFGAVGGALISVAITAGVKFFTPLHWSTYVPIAIVSCMLFGYLLSLLKPQSRDLTGLTVYTPAPKD